MKSELLKQIRSIFKPKQVQLNKRILYFFLFFTISTIIWFFYKLEKTYFSHIDIPIKYLNFPKNVIQTSQLPNKIKVSVYGRGFTILRYKIFTFSTFYIDLKKHLNSTYKGNETVFLYTENLINSLDKEISEEVKILNIEPKSIKFTFAKKSTKKLPVVPIHNYSVENTRILSNINVSPNYVNISGPSNIIDTIDTIFAFPTQNLVLQNTYTANYYLKPIPLCEFSPKQIEVKFFVDKKTEKTIRIHVSSLLTEKNKVIQVMPEYIELKFNVAVSLYHQVQWENFNYELLSKRAAHNKQIVYYYIKINKMPEYISSVRLNPNYFTVITN